MCGLYVYHGVLPRGVHFASIVAKVTEGTRNKGRHRQGHKAKGAHKHHVTAKPDVEGGVDDLSSLLERGVQGMEDSTLAELESAFLTQVTPSKGGGALVVGARSRWRQRRKSSCPCHTNDLLVTLRLIPSPHRRRVMQKTT